MHYMVTTYYINFIINVNYALFSEADESLLSCCNGDSKG